MIQAVIFDMDGLLVDSEPCWHQARVQFAHEFGREWTPADHQAVMGSATHEWAAIMLERLQLDISPAELIERILEKMRQIYRQGLPYRPGAVQAVQLASDHFPTALASGSHRSLIDMLLNDPPMRGRFQVVVCSDDLPHGKPAPDTYLEAARRLALPPERCLCLEDSKNGILSGLAAGMKVIAMPDPRFKPPDALLEQVDAVLESLEEFSLELVRRIS